jgi:hypothetical protein
MVVPGWSELPAMWEALGVGVDEAWAFALDAVIKNQIPTNAPALMRSPRIVLPEQEEEDAGHEEQGHVQGDRGGGTAAARQSWGPAVG